MTTYEGLSYDCPRCGTRHVLACCHASRHNLCDRCVAEQHEARANTEAPEPIRLDPPLYDFIGGTRRQRRRLEREQQQARAARSDES